MIKLNRGGPIALGVIFTTILIDFMGYLILVPVLPEHLESLGADRSDQGLIIGSYMFALVLALPIWGWVADRLGRRPVLITCLLGTSVSFALMANARALEVFYLARIMQGAFGASVGTAQAYIADLTAEHDRARGFGMIGAAGSLGLFGGPALGGLLYGIDPNLPFQAPALLALAAFGAAALFLEESRGEPLPRARWRDLLRSAIPAPLLILSGVHRPRVLVYLYLFFHIFLAFGAVEAMFPTYANVRFGWESVEIGLFLTYIAVVAGVTQGVLIGRLIGFSGERTLVLGGLAIAGGAMMTLTDIRSVPLLALAGLALAFGFGVVVPTFTSLFSKICGEDDTGSYHAHSQAMLNLGRGLGAYVGGVVSGGVGAGAPFLLGGISLLLGLGLFWVLVPGIHAHVPNRPGDSAARIP